MAYSMETCSPSIFSGSIAFAEFADVNRSENSGHSGPVPASFTPMLVCLAALQIGLFAADSMPRPISQLGHTRWTLKDGAPAETEALAQTPDGYLWIGARTRLVRFDGVRFVPFAPQQGDTIPSGGVRRLLATRDSSLWIVWRTGAVSRLRAGRVATYGEKDGLAPAFVLTESTSRTLIAGTRGIIHLP